jgi:SNF2 family DNA or RNA helicase
MELKNHQQSLIDRNPHKYLIAHGAGSGKTITLLSLARINDVECLIVCPKKIKKQWEEYVNVWGQNHRVITKEEFKRDLHTLPRYDGFIFDECHYASNVKSQITKAVMTYITKYNPEYRWLATGTPLASNPPLNVFAYGKILGKTSWNYWSFIKEFYTMVDMGHNRPIPVLRSKIEESLSKYIQEIGETLLLEDVVEVPLQRDITEYFKQTPEQKKAIKELNEPLAITQFTKEHCIEQGLLYSDGYTEDQEFPALKNERLMDIIKDKGQYIVFARYTKQLEFLKNLIEQRYPVKDIFILNGQIKDSGQVIKDANASKDCVFLVQADTAEGWEFSECKTAIFMSLSFSHIKHIQARARILRINNLKENTYYYLVTEGVDKGIFKTIQSKKDFHIDIFGRGRVS